LHLCQALRGAADSIHDAGRDYRRGGNAISASARPIDVLCHFATGFGFTGMVAAAVREFPAAVVAEDEIAILVQCLWVAATTTGTS
jgi:hypothetical protein